MYKILNKLFFFLRNPHSSGSQARLGLPAGAGRGWVVESGSIPHLAAHQPLSSPSAPPPPPPTRLLCPLAGCAPWSQSGSGKVHPRIRESRPMGRKDSARPVPFVLTPPTPPFRLGLGPTSRPTGRFASPHRHPQGQGVGELSSLLSSD